MMDYLPEFFNSPWMYAVLSVIVSFVSILATYIYTKNKEKQLIGKINEESKTQAMIKEDKDLVARGSDSWPMEKDKKEVPEKQQATEEIDVKDPVEFCGHIPSEVKKTQQRIAMKKLQEDMTAEQKAKEREVQRKQLEDIFKLMEQNDDKFGIKSMADVQDQMSLYAQ